MKNLIKNSAFVLALVAGSASLASANVTTIANAPDTYISTFDVEASNSGVTFDLVRAATDGTVYVYAKDKDEQGALLGSKEVRGGANSDVRVNFQTIAATDNYIAVFVPAGSTKPDAAVSIEQ